MKPDDTTTFSIDEELSEEDTFDDAKPSPFLQRSTRKSMNLDCRYGEIEKLLENIVRRREGERERGGSKDWQLLILVRIYLVIVRYHNMVQMMMVKIMMVIIIIIIIIIIVLLYHFR